MVPVLPVPLALRDALLTAGVGFAVGCVYCALRACCTARLWCAVCDAVAFVLAAVCCRAAAAGILAGGVVRWYTLFACACGYFAALEIFFALFYTVVRFICTTVSAPFRRAWHNILCRRAEKAQKTAAKPKRRKALKSLRHSKKGLQKVENILYNTL